MLYQLESRSALDATNRWEAGEVVQPAAGATSVRFNDVRLGNPPQRFFRAKVYDPAPAGMTVAIQDSGWTRAVGLSTTNWNYFVMVESVKEALRSDGTPFVTVGDTGIKNGLLLAGSIPRFPILISLAAEAIADDEIAPLANYVAAGGFILAGSSSFTRHTNGGFRENFTLTSQMGLSCSPSTNNWHSNTYLLKLTDHRLVSHIPSGPLVWRMPTSSEEISWGTCQTHSDGGGFMGPHQIWQVTTDSGVQVLAWGNSSPCLTVNQYSNGCVIYDAALQPLIGHGGFAPGMYAYVIFRRAIEWAFESAQRPVARLSPWPYGYDAAFIVRHDLENLTNEIAHIEWSAQVESAYNARGDYYFCTGILREDAGPGGYDTNVIVASLRQACTTYGATVGPHNGGTSNPVCSMPRGSYEYWHWGPDEVLDLQGGRDYASNSLAISFADIEGWLGLPQCSPRVWVAPYFNATREESYCLQEQLGIKITGDQKLTPFPHWTLSTQTDGKRYPFLSEPVSDWFVRQDGYAAAAVAQSLEPWHPPGVHNFATMHNTVDFYYGLGALINVYSHTLSTGEGNAGNLVPDYIRPGQHQLSSEHLVCQRSWCLPVVAGAVRGTGHSDLYQQWRGIHHHRCDRRSSYQYRGRGPRPRARLLPRPCGPH